MVCYLARTDEGVQAAGELNGRKATIDFPGWPLAGDGSEADARVRRHIGKLLLALHRGEKAPAV